jgi:hypothetical protein
VVVAPEDEDVHVTRISIQGYEPAHISFSTINGYRGCGNRFRLQKVLRLEERPGLAAIGGNAVHTATEQYDLGLWNPSPSGVNEVDNVRVGVDTGSTDNDGSAA